ncbi:MAG: hypothetical protein K2M07_01115 [Muribaculaceae bacterium]|nr:hypothetical protein [Muribaculaceae bacterium]
MNRQEFNIDNIRDRSNPYTVPQGYFEHQERRILVASMPRKGRKVVTLLVAAAASIAVIASVAVFLFGTYRNTPDLDSYIASLSDSELNASIALDDLDTYSEFMASDVD